MKTYITTDGVFWFAFRASLFHRVWPLTHSGYFAPPTLDGVRAVSYHYTSARAARRAAQRCGVYVGVVRLQKQEE